MGIPSPTPKPWYVRATWPAVLALALALPAGAFSIADEVVAENGSGWGVAAAGSTFLAAVVMSILKLLEARYRDGAERTRDSPDNLRGCLHVIHRTLAGYKNVTDPPEGWLRLTVRRVEGAVLEQAVAYVGSEDEARGRAAGRRFSIQAGLIGRVARIKEPRTFERPASLAFEDWVTWLVEHTGMTRTDAEKTRPDRYSFLGIPITGPDSQVRAVLYLDARDEGFFTDSTVDLALYACEGLARWVDEHYYGQRR